MLSLRQGLLQDNIGNIYETGHTTRILPGGHDTPKRLQNYGSAPEAHTQLYRYSNSTLYAQCRARFCDVRVVFSWLKNQFSYFVVYLIVHLFNCLFSLIIYLILLFI